MDTTPNRKQYGSPYPKGVPDRSNLEHFGYLQKRRGGFGKFTLTAWQLRFFTITKNGVLTYYERDPSEVTNPDEVKPRGRLDLRAVNFEFLKDLWTEGAPNQFIMQLCPPNEEKWAMCANSKDDYRTWCKIFEKFADEKPDQSNSAGGNSYFPSNVASDEEHWRDANSRSSSPSTTQTPRGRSGSSVSDRARNMLNSFLPISGRMTPSRSSSVRSRSEASDDNSSNNDANNALSESEHSGDGDGSQGNTSIATSGSRSDFSPARGTSAAAGNKGTGNVGEVVAPVAVRPGTATTGAGVNQGASAGAVTAAHRRKVANVIVGKTLLQRSARVPEGYVDASTVQLAPEAAAVIGADISGAGATAGGAGKAAVASGVTPKGKTPAGAAANTGVKTAPSGKPLAGSTFTESKLAPRNSPEHTWCKCDHRQFQVRIGPNYDRFKKKAPSAAPIYEAFAVDVFCTKTRLDHAARRFALPDTSHINTNHPHVPPIFVVQIQIPADPPPSLFTTVEDGPGWAILMYYRITEDACKQLKNIATASPAVKLFANWCEKAPVDAAWRGRFKVINSCTNLEELGMPQAIISYNAKPVLIRRTGTIFKGPNYMEMDIHVHKFANLAKQSIHLITSRCKLMFMQIGFVIEGRDDSELPETLFACVAVNKPQEDNADFLFDDA